MSNLRAHFKFSIILGLLMIAGMLPLAFAQQEGAGASSFKKKETGLYRDVFDINMYYEFTNFLHLERLGRAIFRTKHRAANVNVFDEVPDASFFTNRHFRNRLSTADLEKGFAETDGPDMSSKLIVYKGKFEGLHPGFFVRDSRGDKYLLKFDPVDNLEMATAAEIIASRFFHAIGYNVPQYNIIVFNADQLEVAPDAETYDDTGFKKKFTPEKLEEYLIFLPQTESGQYRASASKLVPGEKIGHLDFNGRRRDNPEDPADHRDRREIRALKVFGAWLNNYDIRDSNSFEIVVDENGQERLKQYLFDFNSALGSSSGGPKPPMFMHEYMMDYGEAAKGFFTLGWWEKPWQKRWREIGESTKDLSPAVGYFDNRYFDPAKVKIQLPYFAFKDLTRADGFWAAKIIQSFTDEDIRSMVKSGQLSKQEDVDTISNILIERRDIIARYWFNQASPLDEFELSGNQLTFKDLAVQSQFAAADETTYHVTVKSKGKKLASFEAREAAINLEDAWLQQSPIKVCIRTSRGNSKPSPSVKVRVSRDGIQAIKHQD